MVLEFITLAPLDLVRRISVSEACLVCTRYHYLAADPDRELFHRPRNPFLVMCFVRYVAA